MEFFGLGCRTMNLISVTLIVALCALTWWMLVFFDWLLRGKHERDRVNRC